jgi:hypothetical protein
MSWRLTGIFMSWRLANDFTFWRLTSGHDAQLTPNEHRLNTSFRNLVINRIITLPTLLPSIIERSATFFNVNRSDLRSSCAQKATISVPEKVHSIEAARPINRNFRSAKLVIMF